MKKNHFKRIVAILGLFVLAISCEKNSGQIINAALTQEYVINAKDLLKITLGYFGDEEGASILINPLHAKINQIDRPINSSLIYYTYRPLDNYIGKDSVSIIIFKGSDGSINTGKSDTTKIVITITD